MGITRAEFLRSLPAALDGLGWSVEGDRVSASLSGEGLLEIRLGSEGTRRIAALSLPTLAVEFRFEGVPRPAIDAFMSRFERTYQRGGG